MLQITQKSRAKPAVKNNNNKSESQLSNRITNPISIPHHPSDCHRPKWGPQVGAQGRRADMDSLSLRHMGPPLERRVQLVALDGQR